MPITDLTTTTLLHIGIRQSRTLPFHLSHR